MSTTAVVLNVVTYNLASDASGVQWFLDDNGDVILHGERAQLIEQTLLSSCFQVRHATAVPDDEPGDDAEPRPIVIPVLCLQESVLRAVPGFEEIGRAAVTHAGLTQLFVPDAAWRAANGNAFAIEAVGSTGGDRGGSTYDFPIAALRIRVGLEAFARVVITSVHLSPFAKNSAQRAAQLLQAAKAMHSLSASLPAKAVTATHFVVAGDTNMRDEETWPSAAPAPAPWQDAFLQYEATFPQEAWAVKDTWDTSTDYNGTAGARGDYKARYDRVYLTSAAPKQAASTTSAAQVVAMRLLGQHPFVNPVFDEVQEQFRERYPLLDLEGGGVDTVQRAKDASDAMQRVADAATAWEEVDRLSDPAFPRYLSDHFGLVTSLRL